MVEHCDQRAGGDAKLSPVVLLPVPIFRPLTELRGVRQSGTSANSHTTHSLFANFEENIDGKPLWLKNNLASYVAAF
ncbi:hypothetical protein LP7551_04004 [Roseibium album]|nr:hypothetical protein LP7551_04004 [Roseibium album]